MREVREGSLMAWMREGSEGRLIKRNGRIGRIEKDVYKNKEVNGTHSKIGPLK